MGFLYKIGFAIYLLYHVADVKAQSLNHIGLMPVIDHSGGITKKWDYSLYYFGMANLYNDEVNNERDQSNLFVFYSEQALTYKITPSLSATGGYIFERQRPLENTYRNENRFYLQTTLKYQLDRTKVKHRLRFEGRFIQDRIIGKTPFTHRIRYLTGITKQLDKRGDYYFTAYNEFFFNTFKGAPVIYGENWAYAGVGMKTGKNSVVEVGPLYIFWVQDEVNTLNNFYYLQLTWSTYLDFKKKE